MSDPVALARALAADLRELATPAPRHLIALAGPPASGKSTLAEALVAALRADGRPAALVPMDGFHLDNAVLAERGLLARKGAPETFDAAGFASMVERLAQGSEVVVPTFDRTRDIAIAGARVIAPTDTWIVLEGNYLLLDEPVWRDLARHWTRSIALLTDPAELRRRLIDRWREHGLEAQAAEARALSNDIPNAERMAAHSLQADQTVPT